MPGPTRELAKITVPTMGVWSTGDHYLDGERMKLSSDAIDGLWRYEEIAGASHWIPLMVLSELNAMLLDWLTTPSTATTRRSSLRVRWLSLVAEPVDGGDLVVGQLDPRAGRVGLDPLAAHRLGDHHEPCATCHATITWAAVASWASAIRTRVGSSRLLALNGL